MPYVENSRICCSDNFNITPDVFAIESYVFAAPSHDVFVKSPNSEKIWPEQTNKEHFDKILRSTIV